MLKNATLRRVEYRHYPKTLTGDPAECKVTEGTEIVSEHPVCVKHHKEPTLTSETKVVVVR